LARVATSEYSFEAAQTFYASAIYLFLSLTVLVFSKPLAGLLCTGIDNHDG
jgi:hypothetical protein